MKNKVSLIGLCAIVLFSICGCGKNEEKLEDKILGTYTHNSYGKNLKLELYDDSKCYYDDERIDLENTNCTYSVYSDNKIRIEYTMNFLSGSPSRNTTTTFTILENGNLEDYSGDILEKE